MQEGPRQAPPTQGHSLTTPCSFFWATLPGAHPNTNPSFNTRGEAALVGDFELPDQTLALKKHPAGARLPPCSFQHKPLAGSLRPTMAKQSKTPGKRLQQPVGSSYPVNCLSLLNTQSFIDFSCTHIFFNVGNAVHLPHRQITLEVTSCMHK